MSNYIFIPGTFAQDAFRLIRDVQTENLDDVIKIHEDLCTVVFNTVSAYSVWFVVHWFAYGAGMLIDIILISKEIMADSNKSTPKLIEISLCLILVAVLYLFILPCYYAARITSKCNGKRRWRKKVKPIST